MSEGRLYLAGPMRGHEHYNFPAFFRVAEHLASRFEVINPAQVDVDSGFDPEHDTVDDRFVQQAMRRDVALVATCDVIALLPGWEKSHGATVELKVAHACGLKAFLVEERKDGTVDLRRLMPSVAEARAAGEVRVTDPNTGGMKGQKLAQLGALDPLALLAVAEVAGFGSAKYERMNFLKGYDWSLSFDAGQRHRLAFWSGEDRDGESGLYHLAHAAWHDLAELAFLIRGLGTDDRPKT